MAHPQNKPVQEELSPAITTIIDRNDSNLSTPADRADATIQITFVAAKPTIKPLVGNGCLREVKKVIMAAGLMLATGFLTSAVAQPLPIICTEAVPKNHRTNLEYLKDLPVPEIVQFGGVTFVNEQGREISVDTWRKFETAHKNKYWEKTQADIDMADWFWLKRGFIPFLEKAIPATYSFVRTLKPGKELVRLLPLTLAPLLGEESNDVDKAAKKHETWLHFYPNTRITGRTDTTINLKMGRYVMTITILAYGDFDHDGFDDVLIEYSQGVTDGTFSYSGIAVLTRKGPNKLLTLTPGQP